MREIELSLGQVALVDDADFEWLKTFEWWARWAKNTRSYYAISKERESPNVWRTVLMHRLILGLKYKDGKICDHIDGNTLNNQRHNLRIATSQQNASNRKLPAHNISGFKGVCFRRDAGRYQARIRVDGKLISLGWSDNPSEAHALYCSAAREHFGEFANIGRSRE